MVRLIPHMPVRSLLVSVSALVTLLIAAPSLADTSALPLPPAPPSSTATLAGQLAAGLAPSGDAPQPGAFALTVTLALSEPAAPGGAQPMPGGLEPFLADALEAALRSRGWGGPRVSDRAAAREDIAVTVRLDAGQVLAAARRRQLPQTIWQHLRSPRGQVLATATAVATLDLELRTLMGLGRRAVRLDALRVVPVHASSDAALMAAPILDLAIVDLDADGVVEVVALQPDGVVVVGWRRGGLSLLRDHVRWDAPRDGHEATTPAPNPARVRQPFGRLAVVTAPDGLPLLIAASSDRARAALYRLPSHGKLTPVADPQAVRWPLYASGVGSWLSVGWPHGVDVLGGGEAVQEARLGVGATTSLAAISGVHAVRAFAVHGAVSPAWDPVVAEVSVDGILRYWSASQAIPLSMSEVGTVAVFADLDADGAVELLTTSAAVSGPDRLTLYHRLAAPRGPKRLWSGLAPRPVTAAAAGDVDQDGYAEVVVATWGEGQGDLLIVVPKT